MESISPLLLTLQLIVTTVVIAAVVGIVTGWSMSVLGRGGPVSRLFGRVTLIAMVVAIAIPLVLHAAAWEATAGKFGWLFLTQTGARASGTGTYGVFTGLVATAWIHSMVGCALVTIATWYGTTRVPTVIIDQARMEVGLIAAWWRIRLPLAIPWIVAALAATAVLAATEMTVANLYGFRTLADEFYLFYATQPTLGSVLRVLALPLLMVAAVISWWLVAAKRYVSVQRPFDVRGTFPTTADDFDQPAEMLRWCTLAICLTVSVLVMAVPLVGLVVKLGHEVGVSGGEVTAEWSVRQAASRLWQAPRTFAEEYQWTAIVAVVTAIVSALLALPLAAAGRRHTSFRKIIDVVSIVVLVIPGPITGLVTVAIFQADIVGFRTLYGETLIPTVLVLQCRALPAAYWILRSAYHDIGSEILDAASLDASWPSRFWAIQRPLIQRQIAVACLAAAIVASGDVAASLPVLPPGVTTVGTRLFGLLHSGARYQEAALAIWYLAAVVLLALFLIRQKRASAVN